MRPGLALALALALAPVRALACSGEGAMERIERAERLGTASWSASLALFGLALAAVLVVPRLRAKRPFRRLGALALLAFLHPGLWASARSGDCGAMRVALSLAATAACAGLALTAAWPSAIRPKPSA